MADAALTRFPPHWPQRRGSGFNCAGIRSRSQKGNMSESAATQTIVIVGAGQAGGETASELRKQGYAGRIVLVGEETHVPYRRPPLSKAYLNGTATQERLYSLPP